MALPKNTEGISITLPTWLLPILDKMAGDNDLNRSCLCTIAVKEYLLRKMNKPESWEIIYEKFLKR